MGTRILALGLGLGLTLGSVGTPALAEEPLPCVGEVCLGDDVSRLGSIAWTSASDAAARPITARQMQRLETIYRGRYDDMAPYLLRGAFDKRILGALGNIQAACRPHDLIGQYLSEGGNPTRVTIRLLPDEAGRQTWRVVAIHREFPEATSRRQQEEVRQKLETRYGRYDMHRRSPQPGEASYLYAWIGRPTMLLTLTLPPPSVMEDRHAKHPLCGKAPRLSID